MIRFFIEKVLLLHKIMAEATGGRVSEMPRYGPEPKREESIEEYK